ncbi:hypothetical protein [Shimia sp. SDUM112013]|uniref:hypothetical protein n=1 Tax=Shimia sp. SDUM112013 TaxID=3136160 RepID=UPI0032EE923D
MALATCPTLPAGVSAQSGETLGLAEAQIEERVRRSYQYVAVFNVNDKFALDPDNPMSTGGHNRVFSCRPRHRLALSGRPDRLTEQPVFMELPTFDSTYVSLMVTGYDHSENIPMSTTKDDFVGATLRVMPHAAEPERLGKNLAALQGIDVELLSEFLGQGNKKRSVRSWGSPSGISRNLDLREDTARFPPYGSDFEIFEDRFNEVMQFVMKHTTFDPNDELDAGLPAVLEPLGIAPGNTYDPATAPEIDGDALRAVAKGIATEELAKFGNQDWLDENLTGLFKPKGQITLEALTFQSVAGPVGQPADLALHPAPHQGRQHYERHT